MFNVKRIGSTVEITQIPREVSIEVFKGIAAKTEANECLICFTKDSDNYEVIIRHENENMAGAVAWLALEFREPVTGDADISTISKRINVMRVKQKMSTQELEDAIGAPEGSVFRWETNKSVPTEAYIVKLAAYFKCDEKWLRGELSQRKDPSANEAGSFSKSEIVGVCSDIACAIDYLRGTIAKMNGPQLAAARFYESAIEPITIFRHSQKESRK